VHARVRRVRAVTTVCVRDDWEKCGCAECRRVLGGSELRRHHRAVVSVSGGGDDDDDDDDDDGGGGGGANTWAGVPRMFDGMRGAILVMRGVSREWSTQIRRDSIASYLVRIALDSMFSQTMPFAYARKASCL